MARFFNGFCYWSRPHQPIQVLLRKLDESRKRGDQDGPEISTKIDPKIYNKGVNIEMDLNQVIMVHLDQIMDKFMTDSSNLKIVDCSSLGLTQLNQAQTDCSDPANHAIQVVGPTDAYSGPQTLN